MEHTGGREMSEDCACEDCNCGGGPGDLSRLEVLTDLIEFANQQIERGSNLTRGWADLDKWNRDVMNLRAFLPKCEVEEFDERRKRQRHRENCGCMLCEEGRTG